jgi:hypothetical protein
MVSDVEGDRRKGIDVRWMAVGCERPSLGESRCETREGESESDWKVPSEGALLGCDKRTSFFWIGLPRSGKEENKEEMI